MPLQISHQNLDNNVLEHSVIGALFRERTSNSVLKKIQIKKNVLYIYMFKEIETNLFEINFHHTLLSRF